VGIGKEPRGRVPFKLGVSDRSKAYVPIYGEIVAQFDVRKPMILLDNPGFRIPYFEPVVGGPNPSGRACLSSTCDAEIRIACAIQSVIAVGLHKNFAPELP
jgi:hypothetical protein